MARKRSKKQRKRQRKKGIRTLRSAIGDIKKDLKKSNSFEDNVKIALDKAKKYWHIPITGTRIIPIPKIGGAIQLIPILAVLGALSAAGATVSKVANAVKDVNEARKSFKGSGLRSGVYRIRGGLIVKPAAKGRSLKLITPLGLIKKKKFRKNRRHRKRKTRL